MAARRPIDGLPGPNPAPGEVEKAVLSVLDGALRFAYDRVKSEGQPLSYKKSAHHPVGGVLTST